MSALRTLEGFLNTLNFDLRIEIVDSLQFALLIFLDRHQLLDYCCSLLVGTLVVRTLFVIRF